MAGADLRSDFWMSEYITPWDVYAHGVKAVLAHCKTPYQEMFIVDTESYGKALILDGKWQSAVGDEFLYHEAIAHPAMILHGQPRKVLILGGGEGATAREVLRWSTVERVVMVDIDGQVVKACREHLPEMHQNAFDDPRLELVIGDALDFLADTHETWDVVISDLTDPIESGPAFQLFTQEHYQQVKQVLAPNGVLSLQAGPISTPELYLHARLVKTVSSVFACAQTCLCPAMSFGCPIAFIVASPQPFSLPTDPAPIDQLLSAKVTGRLRAVDGVAMMGLLHVPLYIREAIANETEIYTLTAPPDPIGRGSMQSDLNPEANPC
ncbi:MAG: hypothetical protein WBA57_03490 [Elainellaceae cyanobacterium]